MDEKSTVLSAPHKRARRLKRLPTDHAAATAPKQRRLRPLDALARRGLLRHLQAIDHGALTIADGQVLHTFGPNANEQTDLSATLNVQHPQFFRRVAFGGALGAAESYIDGDWTTDNLLAVMRIFTRNGAATAGLERRGWFASALGKWQHRLRHNSKTNSRRNIAAHYDLSNEFFALFLDESMTYSAGLFDNEQTTLHEASLAKIDRLCDKLQLQPDDHLLEIGTGWGAFAVRAAEKYGCRVTTTTISRRQYEYAAAQIAKHRLQDRIQLLDCDYRDLTGTYDKLVSVEMIEAVGHRYLPTFFGKCSRLLKPHGLAAIQAITIPDQRYAAYIKGVDFIQKYIFPGGCLPSLGAMQQAAAKHTDLRLVELADFANDYARTLSCWRERFWQQIEAVRDLGLPDEFIRMWDWYLCYCEAAYRERQIGLAQIVWAKPQAQ